MPRYTRGGRTFGQNVARAAAAQAAARQLRFAYRQAVMNHMYIRRRFYNIAGTSYVILMALRAVARAKTAMREGIAQLRRQFPGTRF